MPSRADDSPGATDASQVPELTGDLLHAGHRLAARTGTVGFLARELMPELPVLLEELHC